MAIKRFSDVGKTFSKNSKVARAKSVVAHVRTVQANLVSVDNTVNKVHAAFQNPKSSYTSTQIKKVLVALGKMNKTLTAYVNKSYQGLKIAVDMGLPNDKIASQIEDIMALKAKIAILRAQAAASVGLVADDSDEDIVQLDETGYAVDDFDPAEDVVPDEPMTDDEITSKKADEGEIIPAEGDQPTDQKLVNPTAGRKKAEDVVEEDETPVDELNKEVPDGDEEVAGEDNEMPGIEFDDNGMDEILGQEILNQDEMNEMGCDEDDEMEQSASIQARKLASSRTIKGGRVAADSAGEADILKDIAAELLR